MSMKVIIESPNCAKCSKLLKLLFKETDCKFKCIRFLKIYTLVEVDLTGLLLSSKASDLGQHLRSVKQRVTTNALLLAHDCVVMLKVSPLFFLYNNFLLVLRNYNWLFIQLLYLAWFTINVVITPVVSLIKSPTDRVEGWKGSIWTTKGLVNITHYTGALVKLISIHLMISSINIYSCAQLLSSATKHTFSNFTAQTLISVNSLHCLRGRKTISWIAWEYFTPSILSSCIR